MFGVELGPQSTFNLDSLIQNIELRNVGPAGMSGRVTAIDVDLKNDHRIFIGSASGGIWLSEDGAISWKPIFDKQNIQSIGSLKIDPSNSSVIWAGTGEGNPRNSHSSGNGIYKSMDGGNSWNCMGLQKTKLIHRILIHPQNPQIVYAGALGSAWGPNNERGLYRSKDGGKSWENILNINDSTGIADVVMDPLNPNKIIAATWQFNRTAWNFHSGGRGSGLHITWDGGDTWKKITHKEGLPKGALGRIGIAIAPSKPSRIYTLVEAKKNRLYQSNDGGLHWELVSSENIGNRPFYYAEFYVDPKNENRIFNLHTFVTISEDGGKKFRTVLDYGKGVHPDHHAFWIHPENPKYMIDGNDGGLNISRDGGVNWRYVTNLPLGQFYHVSIDEQVPFQIYGGMQDNGSWYGPSTVYKRGGIRNQDWREMYFGDGFDVVPVGDGSRYMYAMSQEGNVGLVDKITGANKFIKPIHPAGERLRFNWNAAIARDPFHEDGLYFGSQFVHYSSDRGSSWKIISPDLTSNDTSKQHRISGGLTIDATSAENHTTLLCVAPSPFDKNIIWTGSDDGFLQRSLDGRQHWTNLSHRLPGLPAGAWFSQIRFSTHDKNELFVVANDYRRNNWSSYAYHSGDNGETWTRIVTDADVTGHCHSIIQDHIQPNLLFLGTEQGLFFSLNRGGEWNEWKHKFPSVPVRYLQISVKENSLVVGTFGRSIWVLDDLSPLQFLVKDELDKIKLIYNQPAYQAIVKAADGIRFTADAEFEGPNRKYGLYYYVFVPEAKIIIKTSDSKNNRIKKDQEKEDAVSEDKPVKGKLKSNKLKVSILSLSNDTLYQRKLKYKPGMNVFRWNMRRQSRFGPSRKTRKKENFPARWSVASGQYRLQIQLDSTHLETLVEVRGDPRLIAEPMEFDTRRSYQIKYDSIQSRAGAATDLLVACSSELKLCSRLILNLADTSQKYWKKEIKTVNNKIDSLTQLMLGAKKAKGIDIVTQVIYRDIQRIGRYMNGVEKNNNENIDKLISQVTLKVNDWLRLVNTFYGDQWTEFLSDFDELNISPFKTRDVIPIIEDE